MTGSGQHYCFSTGHFDSQRRPFRVRFQGNTLLNMKNICTVSDFVFNGCIVRSVVGGFNPKTLIKCHFLEKKL